MNLLSDFIQHHQITEVECLVPDMSGIARGKILPAEKFLRILRDAVSRLPESIFIQTVTGEYPDDEDVIGPADPDIHLRPDAEHDAPRALVHRADRAGDQRLLSTRRPPVEISPRYVLRRVLELYAHAAGSRWWRPSSSSSWSSSTRTRTIR